MKTRIAFFFSFDSTRLTVVYVFWIRQNRMKSILPFRRRGSWENGTRPKSSSSKKPATRCEAFPRVTAEKSSGVPASISFWLAFGWPSCRPGPSSWYIKPLASTFVKRCLCSLKTTLCLPWVPLVVSMIWRVTEPESLKMSGSDTLTDNLGMLHLPTAKRWDLVGFWVWM